MAAAGPPVAVRRDAWSDRIARTHHARAFAFGEQIGLRAGESAALTGPLVRHELVHVLQQWFGDERSASTQERDAAAGRRPGSRRGRPRRALQLQREKAVRIVISGSSIVVTTDAARDNTVRSIISVASTMTPGTYSAWFDGRTFVVDGHPGGLVFNVPGGSANGQRIAAAMRATPHSSPATLVIRSGPSGAGSGSGSGTGSGFARRRRRPVQARSSAGQIAALQSSGAIPTETGEALRSRAQSGQPLTAAQQQALLQALERGLVATAPPGVSPTGTAAEMAAFLERNQDLQPAAPGTSPTGLTLSEIQTILDTYAQTTQGGPQAMAQQGLDEAAVGADPRFAALTPAERDIWREYLRLHPSDQTTSDGGPVDLNPDQLFRMALRMSPASMPAGVADSLEQILTSPIFWTSIFVSILIYLALWLAPEPIISKSLAITITLALLAVFAASEIIHLAQAWSTLQDDTTRIATFSDLEAAAARFGHAVGETGGRILIQLALLLAGGALPRPTPPPGGFGPAMLTAGGPRLATAPAIQVLTSGEVVVATTATLPSMVAMASSSGGQGGGTPPPGGQQTPGQASGPTPGQPARGPAAPTGPAPTPPTAPIMPAGTNRRLVALVQRIFERASAGRFNRASGYHGDSTHQFSDATVARILAEPEAIYLSSGRAGRLIYRRGGDIAVVEGPGSGGGNAITAYGPSGVRGQSGATALGGQPTDPGIAVTDAMITSGTIPTGPTAPAIPPATRIWP